ncbi:CDP-diacylglycerol-glycerol-3-phosphate 3-phosphatidyltransferase [Acinetobacter sp. CIP 101934]|uniref:CDP-diacylglycerol--glycerol-3-phosphate 3-phosphatidyltransferase n=3 Tax=Acinetobacter schindleri TaxID=108981 RepID=N9APJ5_9GAMM|nr:CDP-diacylglycerol-glycerol-3-phosphate 3-phosphatidyltransferase [Acinetobacter schindleri NIPH 900]ENV45620.1 CDP-diacylglycerol-glycerol-3-phosphate 3-phosphatidyltransferase [Acinetobacter schindleri CIP 107287]ENX02898.1 CDP-diacylglycerol-glycerol-3-phosphate 3-phosphatidyltransferase [Acinetobacter sp. CIP 101934]
MAVSMTTGRILNIPNILTLARIVLIPVFLLVAYWPPAMGIDESNPDMTRHMLLTAIFVVAAVTDWFDGYLARTLNQTSAFGRFLDPVADKLMVAAALIVLVQWQPSISMAFAAIVIISREITVSALREWMAELGARTSVAVSTVGKYKTAFQMIAITVFLLNWQPLDMLAYALLYTAVVLTLWSMFIYLKAAWPYLKQP